MPQEETDSLISPSSTSSVSLDEDAILRRPVKSDDDDTATSVAVVENPPPTYSGVYELDEFFMTIAGERKYRVTIWDHLVQAPVGDAFSDRRSNAEIATIVESVLRSKPMLACIKDGRLRAATLVADELGALHYRCTFHKIAICWRLSALTKP